MPRYRSLYAIIEPQQRVWYVGSTWNFKARMARHAWDLQNRRHHSPLLLDAYDSSQRTGQPLMALGLDWSTDDSLIDTMEKILICFSTKLVPGWLNANMDEPTEAQILEIDDSIVTSSFERLGTQALPSIFRSGPMVAGQLFGKLEDFLNHTNAIRSLRRRP